jgi:hypothetical protein
MDLICKMYELIDPPSVATYNGWAPAAVKANDLQEGVEQLKSCVLEPGPMHMLWFLSAYDIRSLNLVSKQMNGILSDPITTQQILSNIFCRFRLYPHQYSSLLHMAKSETQDTRFGSLRGGILGDSPGLGKTVTMIACIVNTIGVMPQCPRSFYDQDAVALGWARCQTGILSSPLFIIYTLDAYQA